MLNPVDNHDGKYDFKNLKDCFFDKSTQNIKSFFFIRFPFYLQSKIDISFHLIFRLLFLDYVIEFPFK